MEQFSRLAANESTSDRDNPGNTLAALIASGICRLSRDIDDEINKAIKMRDVLMHARFCTLSQGNLGDIGRIYEGNTFSDEAFARYATGDSSLIVRQAKKGGFINKFVPSIREQWEKDFQSQSHIRVGMYDSRIAKLLGYMDGYAPPCSGSESDMKNYAERVDDHIASIEGSEHDPTLKALASSPSRIAIIGTIAVDEEFSGMKIGHLLMHQFLTQLMRRLPSRASEEDYAVLSYRFNQITPARLESSSTKILNNSASHKFFGGNYHSFAPIGFQSETVERSGCRFLVKWLHEKTDLRSLAEKSGKITEQIRKDMLEHGGKRGMPGWITNTDEWENLCEKHNVQHMS